MKTHKRKPRGSSQWMPEIWDSIVTGQFLINVADLACLLKIERVNGSYAGRSECQKPLLCQAGICKPYRSNQTIVEQTAEPQLSAHGHACHRNTARHQDFAQGINLWCKRLLINKHSFLDPFGLSNTLKHDKENMKVTSAIVFMGEFFIVVQIWAWTSYFARRKHIKTENAGRKVYPHLTKKVWHFLETATVCRMHKQVFFLRYTYFKA